MPVHIGEMTTEITVVEGELPLTTAQIEKLVKLVMSRIEMRNRDLAAQQDATQMRTSAASPAHME
jgi:hypothetical protein